MADALLELFNIGVGRAARGLSELTGREVAMAVPPLEVLDQETSAHGASLCEGVTLRISQTFTGALSSTALLVLNRAGAVRLAERLLGKAAGDDAFDDNEQGAMLNLISKLTCLTPP